jgi:hypothetical protein
MISAIAGSILPTLGSIYNNTNNIEIFKTQSDKAIITFEKQSDKIINMYNINTDKVFKLILGITLSYSTYILVKNINTHVRTRNMTSISC